MDYISGVENFELNIVLYLQQTIGDTFLVHALGLLADNLAPVSLARTVVPILAASLREDLSLFCGVAYALAELITCIFKWGMQGERPYWALVDGNLPVKQFEGFSCESSYGMPSGHVLILAAVLHTFVLRISRESVTSSRMHVVRGVNALLCSLLSSIAFSRVLFGAHFLSQTLVGWLTGLCIAAVIDWVDDINGYTYLVGGLLALAILAVQYLVADGVTHSLALAKMACQDSTSQVFSEMALLAPLSNAVGVLVAISFLGLSRARDSDGWMGRVAAALGLLLVIRLSEGLLRGPPLAQGLWTLAYCVIPVVAVRPRGGGGVASVGHFKLA